jgi:hypothetical protein
MPFFSHDNDFLATGNSRSDDLFNNILRNRSSKILQFALFSVIDPIGMIMADPLTPAMLEEPALRAGTDSLLLRVTNKKKKGLIPPPGQGHRQPTHPDPQPSGQGIAVRSFK